MSNEKSTTADYGVYIEQSHAVILTVRDGETNETDLVSQVPGRERFRGEKTDQTRTDAMGHSNDRERQDENRRNTAMKKFCKDVVAQLQQPESILIFGPSDGKFELQKTILATKRLKGIQPEIETTGQLDSPEINRFYKNHFEKSATVPQQKKGSTADKLHAKPGSRGKLLKDSGKMRS